MVGTPADPSSPLCGRLGKGGSVSRPRSLGALISLWLALLVVASVAAASAHAGLSLATSEEHGTHVVSEDGWSVYVFLRDGDEETSTCVDACAERWPPLLLGTKGDPQYAEGVDLELVGSVVRPDGGVQVTYGGWPLYRFADDAGPGETNGHEIGGVWYLISATGDPIGHDAVEAPSFDEVMDAGQEVYRRICAACHAVGGTGGEGPRLVANPRVGDADYLVDTILRGFGYMPGFGRQLSDADVAAVATYVRNSWDNEYPVVSEEEVSRIR